MINKKNKFEESVYAIVRIDHFLDETDVRNNFVINKIVWTQEIAESKVERLNDLNSDKNCEYFWQYTKIEEKPAPAHP